MAKRPRFPLLPSWRNLAVFKVGRADRGRRVIDVLSTSVDGGATLVFPGYRLVFTKGFARIVYERAGCWWTYGLAGHSRRPFADLKRRIRIGDDFDTSPADWDAFFDEAGIDLGDRRQPAKQTREEWLIGLRNRAKGRAAERSQTNSAELIRQARDALTVKPPMMTPATDLEADLGASSLIRERVKDHAYAKRLYSALCNTVWHKAGAPSDETWSCSWRAAGRIVAALRFLGEDYIDFYCGGDEAMVADGVRADLADLGWTLVKAEPPDNDLPCESSPPASCTHEPPLGSSRPEWGGICAITGDSASCTIEPAGLIDCGYGSRYDTSQFVFLGECPVTPPAWISDQLIEQWLAEGRIAPYQPLKDRDLLPLDRKVFKMAFGAERRQAGDLTALLAAGNQHALGSLVDSKHLPDPVILARLDVLIEALTGKAPGLDAMLHPWSKQAKAFDAFIDELARRSGDKKE